MKASGAVQIDQLKNLIWTSLAELSPGHGPGLACRLKSPVGTTEKGIESGIAASELPVVPTGLFVLRISNPGLCPGLSSAVPAGLILQSVDSHAHILAPEIRLLSCFEIAETDLSF